LNVKAVEELWPAKRSVFSLIIEDNPKFPAVNISNIARECHIGRSTVAGHMQILEDLLLGCRVPVFSKRARRATTVHPKFYYFDAGVYRSLRPTGPLDGGGDVRGPGLEGLVAQHLRGWIAYGRRDAELFYWRTRGGAEVDFIVYGPGTFVAVEVKNAATVNRRDLRGLRTFREDYPEAQAVFLYRGSDALRVSDIPCLPCDRFLASLVPGEPLPERL